MGWETTENVHPAWRELGAIVSCQERRRDAAFLVLDGSPESAQTELIDRLVGARDPYRTATVIRATDTHLPSPFPGIWEAKSRIRILQASAAGLSCPQRILTHSRIQLLDRLDSNSG
jgi:hypothetical protein